VNEISKNLSKRRIELGLTQQDAAVLIGVSRITYIKWEKDTNTMPIGKYEDLMVAFDRLKALKEEE
jgi:DNA-binding XRE family transcriptional regulator